MLISHSTELKNSTFSPKYAVGDITRNVKMIRKSARCDSCSMGKKNRMKLHGETKAAIFPKYSCVPSIVVMLVVLCIL